MEPVTSGPYALKNEPSIWSDFQRILKASGSSAILQKLERFAFFDAGKDHNVALTIATGEHRLPPCQSQQASRRDAELPFAR